MKNIDFESGVGLHSLQSMHVILIIFLLFFKTSSKVYPNGCSKKNSQWFALNVSNPFITLGKDLISIIGM